MCSFIVLLKGYSHCFSYIVKIVDPFTLFVKAKIVTQHRQIYRNSDGFFVIERARPSTRCSDCLCSPFLHYMTCRLPARRRLLYSLWLCATFSTTVNSIYLPGRRHDTFGFCLLTERSCFITALSSSSILYLPQVGRKSVSNLERMAQKANTECCLWIEFYRVISCDYDPQPASC